MRGLADKVAVVTGTTGAMGQAIAARLAEEGVAVIGTGRRSEAGAGAARAIESAGGRATFVAGDLTVEADVQRVVDAAIDRYGRLDIVVNNAAPVDAIRNGAEGTVEAVSLATFDRSLDVGVRAALLLARAALPHLGAGSSFVTVSSTIVRLAQPGLTGYAVAKAALEALTRQLAVEHGPRGIRANVVALGSVRVQANAALHDGEVGLAMRSAQMLPTSGQPADVAAAVAFLASDDAAFITGAVLALDGGTSAKKHMPDVSDAYVRLGTPT